MHFHYVLLVLLGFVIGAQACKSCPKPKKSKDCNQCIECLLPSGRSNRNMDLWCNAPVCGGAWYGAGLGAYRCQVTWEGLCGLYRCEKEVT